MASIYGQGYDALESELSELQRYGGQIVRAGAGWTLGTDYYNRQAHLTQQMEDIRSGRAAGRAATQDAVSTAERGVGIADEAAGRMRGDAVAMRSNARLVNTQAGRVNESADALSALIPQLDPYKDKLGRYGDDLNAVAGSLQEQAKDIFGQGGALVNLDPSKGGLSAEYQQIYDYLSPDNYVSRAASDTQSAFDNAAAQQNRALARQGVSAGSGASMALRQQISRAAAVALASAKTNARQQGVNEQGKFLDQMTNAANVLYNMGNQTQQQALAAKGAAGNMQQAAAGIVKDQGAMQADVGRLREQAGALFAQGAQIFGSAAGVEASAANLSLSALNGLRDAYNAAAAYYTNGIRSASGGGGGGGVAVTKEAKAPDYWEETGHSATYWKNNLSSDGFQKMADAAAKANMAAKTAVATEGK